MTAPLSLYCHRLQNAEYKMALLFARLQYFQALSLTGFFCCCCDPGNNIPSCLKSYLVSTDRNQRPTFSCLIKRMEQRILTFVETLIPGTLHRFQSQSYVTLGCLKSLCVSHTNMPSCLSHALLCVRICSCVSLCKGVSLQ